MIEFLYNEMFPAIMHIINLYMYVKNKAQIMFCTTSDLRKYYWQKHQLITGDRSPLPGNILMTEQYAGLSRVDLVRIVCSNWTVIDQRSCTFWWLHDMETFFTLVIWWPVDSIRQLLQVNQSYRTWIKLTANTPQHSTFIYILKNSKSAFEYHTSENYILCMPHALWK